MASSQELEDFRSEVRTFIEEKLPEVLKGGRSIRGAYDIRGQAPERAQAETEEAKATKAALKDWRQALQDKGWLAANWPKEFGQAELDVAHQYILNQELLNHSAPRIFNMGLSMIGPTIMSVGTEEQIQRMIPPILNGEVAWCELFSEPGAGSDLGGLQTKAVRDGDHYIVNGQKIWTSEAPYSDFGLLMARTDPDAPKHKGISMFRVDMKAPGVTVRPILAMNGSSEQFNEVFFEDVKIPVEDLIGQENHGWYALMNLLNTERSAISTVKQIERTFESILSLAKDPEYMPLSEETRTELANRKIEVEVMRGLSDRVARKQLAGSNLANEASILKLFHTELSQRLASTAMRVAGQEGLLSSKQEDAPLNGLVGDHYLYASTLTIQVGTSEVQRNIIALRGLGLPKS